GSERRVSGALAGQVALVVGANGRIGGRGRPRARRAGRGPGARLAGRGQARAADRGAAVQRRHGTCDPDGRRRRRRDAPPRRRGGRGGHDDRRQQRRYRPPAGTAHRPAPLGDLALDDVDRVLRVTLRGVLVAMRDQLAALPDGGSVVNVVSTAGLAGAPGMGAYAAAEHGVVGLTRTAALDYADRGVRVNAVAPGAIDSGGTADQPPEVKQRIGSFAPLGRLGTPEEVAAAVAWLASPAAAFTTGAILAVDGGKGARGA